MIRTNCWERLKWFGRSFNLTKIIFTKGILGVFSKFNRNKYSSKTGEVDPLPQLLAKEKFTFQINVSPMINQQDMPPILVLYTK